MKLLPKWGRMHHYAGYPRSEEGNVPRKSIKELTSAWGPGTGWPAVRRRQKSG